MKIIFYTNGCTRCNILKQKLNEKKVNYIECDNIDLLMAKGFTTVPMIEVDGCVMDFNVALNWVKEI